MIVKHLNSLIRANKVVIDLEGNDEEIVHFRVRGKDAHVSVRTDGTADGVIIVAGGKMYRQPVDEDSEEKNGKIQNFEHVRGE